MGVERRGAGSDDDSRGSDLGQVPDVQPEPVNVGGVKLTLPGRPSRPAPQETRSDDADSADSVGAQDKAGDDALLPATDAGPDGDAASQETPMADEWVNYAEIGNKASRRHVDYRVVQVLAGGVALVVVAAGLVWWFGHSRGVDEAGGYEVQIPAGGSSAAPAAAPPVVDDVLPLMLDSRCDNQTEPRLAGVGTDGAWSCPTLGVPFGQKIVGTLPKPYVLTGVKFWPGFHAKEADGRDGWDGHRVIDEAQLVCNDAERSRIELAPHGERREYSVPINHLIASACEFTVLASSPAPVTADEPADDQVPEPLFRGPHDSGEDRENDPSASSVALSGFALIGHAVP